MLDKKELLFRQVMQEEGINRYDVLRTVTIPARICRKLKEKLRQNNYDDSHCFRYCPYSSSKSGYEADHSCLYRNNSNTSETNDNKLFFYEDNLNNKLNELLMSKNHMKEVADLLGVNINQKFNLLYDDKIYVLEERGLVNTNNGDVYPNVLVELLKGREHIVKFIDEDDDKEE